MTLADLASLGSFVSGIAVLVSLVFLYFQLRQIAVQIRQAERNQQAAIRQNRVGRIVDSLIATQDASSAEAVWKGQWGNDDITLTQLLQFSNHALSRLFNAEDTFYQHRDGFLNDDGHASFVRTMRAMYTRPGMRAMYRQTRGLFGPEFVAFMDGVLAEVPAIENGDALASWKEQLAAERRQA